MSPSTSAGRVFLRIRLLRGTPRRGRGSRGFGVEGRGGRRRGKGGSQGRRQQGSERKVAEAGALVLIFVQYVNVLDIVGVR